MHSTLQDTMTRLNTGLMIPRIGFGTWKLAEGGEAYDAVSAALAQGYRLIDTAAIYGNEESVGRAVRESGIPRDEIFITTKVWKSDMGHARTKAAYENSLKRLGLDYVDLYLIHWPSSEEWKEAWQAMEELYREERVKNIGVSNFTVDDLEQLHDIAHLVPAVNQIELHPFNYKHQKATLEYCREKGIIVEAYSPLTQSVWMDHAVINKLAELHDKTPAQILLRWSIQHDAVPIPKSSKPRHMQSNLDIFDFVLSEAEMVELNKLGGDMSVMH